MSAAIKRLFDFFARRMPGIHHCTFGDVFGSEGLLGEWIIHANTGYWSDVRINRCPTCGQHWQASGEDNCAVRLSEEEARSLLDDPPSSWTPMGPRLAR